MGSEIHDVSNFAQLKICIGKGHDFLPAPPTAFHCSIYAQWPVLALSNRGVYLSVKGCLL